MSIVHPLIPVIQDLRSALSWLNESGNQDLNIPLNHAIFHKQKNDNTTRYRNDNSNLDSIHTKCNSHLFINRYQSDHQLTLQKDKIQSNLTQAIHVLQTKSLVSLPENQERAHIKTEIAKDNSHIDLYSDDLKSTSELKLSSLESIEVVPLHALPAVDHTRHERPSISFESLPPDLQAHDLKIPAISPINKTAQRLLMLHQYTAQMNSVDDQSRIKITQSLHAEYTINHAEYHHRNQLKNHLGHKNEYLQAIDLDLQTNESLKSEASLQPNSPYPNDSSPSESSLYASTSSGSSPQFWAQHPPAFDAVIPTNDVLTKESTNTSSTNTSSTNTSSTNTSSTITQLFETHQNTVVNANANVHSSSTSSTSSTLDKTVDEQSLHDTTHEAWSSLIQSPQNCNYCQSNNLALHQDPCIGIGYHQADFLFVYDQMSHHECRVGLPLSDPQTAVLFADILTAIGLKRSQIYVTALFTCSHQAPSPAYWQTRQESWHTTLELIRPKAIISLGQMTSQVLLDEPPKGEWKKYQNIPTLATFSPQEVQRGHKIKKQHWKHLQKLIRKFDLLPSS
jgi:uracil-DNA glycosylase family 4